jgi:hypothetical protein
MKRQENDDVITTEEIEINQLGNAEQYRNYKEVQSKNGSRKKRD